MTDFTKKIFVGTDSDNGLVGLYRDPSKISDSNILKTQDTIDWMTKTKAVIDDYKESKYYVPFDQWPGYDSFDYRDPFSEATLTHNRLMLCMVYCLSYCEEDTLTAEKIGIIKEKIRKTYLLTKTLLYWYDHLIEEIVANIVSEESDYPWTYFLLSLRREPGLIVKNKEDR